MVHIYDMRNSIFYEVKELYGVDICDDRVYSKTMNRPAVGRERGSYQNRQIC